jgi:hypothetical protein
VGKVPLDVLNVQLLWKPLKRFKAASPEVCDFGLALGFEPKAAPLSDKPAARRKKPAEAGSMAWTFV